MANEYVNSTPWVLAQLATHFSTSFGAVITAMKADGAPSALANHTQILITDQKGFDFKHPALLLRAEPTVPMDYMATHRRLPVMVVATTVHQASDPEDGYTHSLCYCQAMDLTLAASEGQLATGIPWRVDILHQHSTIGDEKFRYRAETRARLMTVSKRG